MGRSLFLLIISSLIGVVSNPLFLTATDSFNLTGLDNTGVVETVPLPESEPEPESVPEPAKAPVAGYTYVPPANNIQVAGRTIEIVDVGDTRIDAGNHVNKYGARFLYGHNSWNVFGGLTSLGVGSTFTITYGGVSTNYQVANVVIYEKNVGNGLLQINGFGDYMYSVAMATHDSVQYDLSLMTCYGTSYGNGDASHRWVVFANAI